MSHLAKALENGFVYDGCYSPHRRRRHGRAPDNVPKSRLLGYLQNHDQVGNRAAGDRITSLASIERVKAAAALVFASPFVPMIFQGEEWAASSPFLYFTNHTDPELGRIVLEGRRSEFSAFGWAPESVPDPQAPQTFRRSKLDWSELDRAPHSDVLRWYRDLIALRRRIDGDVRVDFSESERWIRMDRGDTSVVCNLAETQRTIPASGDILAASRPGVQSDGRRAVLPPESAAIMRDGATGNRPARLAGR
jgi:maltooligosyltrehalose trehalohydrolase